MAYGKPFIYIDRAIDIQRVRLELLYKIEIQRLILRKMAWAIRSDALYLPLQAQMIQVHFASLFAQDPQTPPPTMDIPTVPQSFQ